MNVSSGTIDSFRVAFQEEARELLVELESALLELDQQRDNPEIVGRAFRALHTIKGSGAMFGFDDITAFAHGLETAFDRLRNGELAVTTDLINLTLMAGDQIKTMLDHSAGRATVDLERSARILADLQRLTDSSEAAAAPSQVTESPHETQPPGEAHQWKIHFRPAPNVLTNGTNPLLLLRELRDLGQVQVVVDTAQIPSLTELEPENCYVSWDIVLSTSAPLEAIRDVFIFLEDDCDLTIEQQPEVSTGPVPASGSTPKWNGLDRRAGGGATAASSVRVSADKLDQLVNLVGELVTVQARLSEVAAKRDDPDILEISEAVDRLTSSLRENSMSIRMLPLRSTFERFRRLVRDLGADLHKDVELAIEGADTELDKTVIDQLNDPLVHLIRNSMDHGVETSDVRRAAGKPPIATIRISARHSGANVLVQVSDDGRGVDVEAVRTRAIERGLIDSAARLTEAETLALILEPGFSTAREVSEISGRGVGMDVVRRSVDELRGTIEIESQPGKGMTVTLRLPLTLAIIDGLLVRVGRSHFVLPLANSLECVELTRQDIQDAHGKHIANLRGELIPYIRLGEYFQMGTARPEREQIMVVETEHGRYGFVVDEVLGDHQTVIKNLGRLYRNVQVVSGATILGSGAVALILDPHRLVQSAVQNTLQTKRSDVRNTGADHKNISSSRQGSSQKENRLDG